ncbi:MAG TPA: hypothetical protein PKN45_11070 [Candidatus Limiplasma sp.]|nr:hypothetical protein [Candidatus Limiplasma sp.]
METMWVLVNDAGRVTDTVIGGKLDGGTDVEIPEGYNLERQQDWKLVDRVLIYDPEVSV